MKFKPLKNKEVIRLRGRTGEQCPLSGVWKVIANKTTTATIARGNIFPPHDGKDVTWKLVHEA